MPYKQWAVGEEMLAASFQDYIQDQTVNRFADSTARAAAITAPKKGQASILDNAPGVIQVWNGSAWINTIGPATRWVYQLINLDIGANSANAFEFPAFVVPIGGSMIVDLQCWVTGLAGGPGGQQFVASLMGSIVGVAPTDAPQSVVQAIENFTDRTIPVKGFFSALAAGSNQSIKVKFSTGTGGGGVHVSYVSGSFTIWPTGSVF